MIPASLVAFTHLSSVVPEEVLLDRCVARLVAWAVINAAAITGSTSGVLYSHHYWHSWFSVAVLLNWK